MDVKLCCHCCSVFSDEENIPVDPNNTSEMGHAEWLTGVPTDYSVPTVQDFVTQVTVYSILNYHFSLSPITSDIR